MRQLESNQALDEAELLRAADTATSMLGCARAGTQRYCAGKGLPQHILKVFRLISLSALLSLQVCTLHRRTPERMKLLGGLI